MPARSFLATTLMIALVASGWGPDCYGQNDEPENRTQKQESNSNESGLLDDDVQERVLQEVEKALRKFESEMGEGKLDRILERLEESLSGKLEQFQIEMESLDPEKLKLGATAKWSPKIFQFQPGTKRRVIGVALTVDEEDRVKVEKVMPESAADEAGIKAGDVLIKVNGKPVEDAESLSQVIQESKGEIEITVSRQDENLVVKVEPRELAGQKLADAMVELDGIEFGLPGLGDRGIPRIILLDKDAQTEEKQVEPGKAGKPSLRKKIFKVQPGGAGDSYELKLFGGKDAEEKFEQLRKQTEEIRERIQRKVEMPEGFQETIEQLKQEMKQLREELEKFKASQVD